MFKRCGGGDSPVDRMHRLKFDFDSSLATLRSDEAVRARRFVTCSARAHPCYSFRCDTIESRFAPFVGIRCLRIEDGEGIGVGLVRIPKNGKPETRSGHRPAGYGVSNGGDDGVVRQVDVERFEDGTYALTIA